jgi:hypothetical protein
MYLKVRHEHQVSSLEPLIVNGVVVDVTQDGLGSKPVGRVLRVDELAKLVHDLQTCLLFSRNQAL